MSYILDALKKSEKERQRGSLPDMLTVQDIVAEKPKKRFVWPALLVAVLLLNAGVFVWWSGFFQTKEVKIMRNSMPVALPSSTNEATREISGRDKSTPESAEPISPQLSSVDSNIAPLIKKPVSPLVDKNSLRSKGPEGIVDVRKKRLPAHAVSPKETAKAVELSPAEPDQGEGTGSLLSEPTGRISETIDENRIYSSIRQKLPSFSITADENKLYHLKELPPSVRQNLPPFSISALMYASSPASRMVRINDQMLHEGQELSAGLKLVEITKDGVIFRIQKYRFYVGVK
jgi:general secretion pathway protein B